jgi:hypothetical protein
VTYFQVLLLVSNVAPEGSQLNILDAAARLVLPPGDPGAETPPLVAAQLADFPGVTHELCEGDADSYDPLLCREVLNSTTGKQGFGSSENGSADWVLEGKEVGSYRVEVNINPELALQTGQSAILSTHGVAGFHPPFRLDCVSRGGVCRAGWKPTRRPGAASGWPG